MRDSLKELIAAALGDVAQTFGQTGALLAHRPGDDMLFAQAGAALAAIEPLLEAMRRHIRAYEPGTLVGSELNVALHLRDLDGEIWEPWCVPGDPAANEDAQFRELVEMVEASGTHVVVPIDWLTEVQRKSLAARPRDAAPTGEPS